MQVVILAGGLGTRLQSVAGGLPKSLVPIAGRPFIDHQLELIAQRGLRDVLLCVGYGGKEIEAHVGTGVRYGLQVEYSHEDASRLLGTGGALVQALPRLHSRFLVMYGDAYLTADYGAVARTFEQQDDPILMCVFRNEGKWDTSNVRVADDRVIWYSKVAKPNDADCIDYGLSAYRRSVIEIYRQAPLPLDLARIQEEMVQAGRVRAFVVATRFYEMGRPDSLAELDTLLQATEQSRQRGQPQATVMRGTGA